MNRATTKRLPRQQYLVVRNDGREATRLPSIGVATLFAAKLDEQSPENAPHRVVGFRDAKGVA